MWQSNRPAKGGEAGAMLATIIERAARLKAGQAGAPAARSVRGGVEAPAAKKPEAPAVQTTRKPATNKTARPKSAATQKKPAPAAKRRARTSS